jgi:hypothetical protein
MNKVNNVKIEMVECLNGHVFPKKDLVIGIKSNEHGSGLLHACPTCKEHVWWNVKISYNIEK